jgi:hypothetical protein
MSWSEVSAANDGMVPLTPSRALVESDHATRMYIQTVDGGEEIDLRGHSGRTPWNRRERTKYRHIAIAAASNGAIAIVEIRNIASET